MLKICRNGHLTGYKRCPQCGAAAATVRLADDAPDPAVTISPESDRRMKRLSRSRVARWIAGPGFEAQEARKRARRAEALLPGSAEAA